MKNKERKVDYVYLPEGTILNNRYKIKRKLVKRSNLSIVYLAVNLVNQKKVVIKEFFPKKLVLRGIKGKKAVCKKNSYKEEFKREQENFLKEAKIMQKIKNNKYTARCFDYFKENNTSYLVMKYYRGPTLQEYLQEHDISIIQFLKEFYFPLLNAVDNLHDKGYIHRDIKLSNIIVYLERPILIDFGAALDYKKDKLDKIMLTPAFSPIEFYSQKASRGQYSDIYSLTVVLYYLLTNKLPPEAKERVIEDKIIPVNKLCPEIPDSLNRLIMKNLSLKGQDRDQSISSFKIKLKKEYFKLKIKDLILNFQRNLSYRSYRR